MALNKHLKCMFSSRKARVASRKRGWWMLGIGRSPLREIWVQ